MTSMASLINRTVRLFVSDSTSHNLGNKSSSLSPASPPIIHRHDDDNDDSAHPIVQWDPAVTTMALQNRLHSALLCGSLKAITHTTASLWVGVQQMCGNIKAITHVCGSLKAITHATASLWVGGQTNVW